MAKKIQPVPVVLVRPEHRGGSEMVGYLVGTFIGFAASMFTLALILWWLGPLIFGDWYSLGYWQSFALLFFIRALTPRRTPQYQSRFTALQPKPE